MERVGDIAGYRMVLQAHYDGHFDGDPPERALARAQACAPYLARVLHHLDLPDDGTHLDLGCGSGLAALAVARARPAMRVVGVDASGRAVAAACEAAAREGLANVSFEQGDAEAPPAGVRAERATALSLFNLMPDKLAALRAWRRALRPGARLVLTDGFALAGPGSAGAGAATDALLARLCRDAGFEPVRRENLTPLVRRLDGRREWPWPEYVRPGFAYVLHALVAR